MKHKAVKKLFPEWFSGRVSAKRAAQIQDHLTTCSACQEYYHQMTQILKNVGTSDLPVLESDPYLPARIRELSKLKEKGTIPESIRGKFQLALATLLLLLAMTFGFYLGKSLAISTVNSPQEELIADYSRMFSEETIIQQWESSISEGEESNQ